MIRKYEEKDLEAEIEVWFKASSLAHPFLSEAFMEGEKDNIRNVYSKVAETWVAEIDGSLVGFISLIGNEVGALFVDPEFHGKKIGKALMDFAVAQRGNLFLDVFKRNTIGRRFYARYGFAPEYEHVFEQTGDAIIRLVYKDK